jgi:hypothetical protein
MNPRSIEEAERHETKSACLVVGRSSPVQLAVLLRQDERIGVPPVLLGGGLDVEVAVHAERLQPRIGGELPQQNGRQRAMRGGGRVRKHRGLAAQPFDAPLRPSHHVHNILQVNIELRGNGSKAASG